MGDRTDYHLIKLHQPDAGWDQLQILSARARAAVERVNSAEAPVRFLRLIFVPEDETCFHLFEGTAAAVAEAVNQSAISTEDRHS